MNKSFKDLHYFPAYEIVVDQLRDYRFYKKDRIHPNDEACDYIWDKFSSALLTEESSILNRNLDKLFSSINHRSYRETSASNKRFLKQTLELAIRLNKKVDLEEELKKLKTRIQ